MAVALWSYEKVRILALTDDAAPEGGHLARPASVRGVCALDGLRLALEPVLNRGCRAILLDMQRVTHLESADIGELFACRKRVLHQGGDIALLHLVGRPRRMVEMVDLNRMLRIFDDEAEALAALGG